VRLIGNVEPTRGADRNRSLNDQADPATDEMLLPQLDDGITLLDVEGGRGVPILQSLVLDHLLLHDGPAFCDVQRDCLDRLDATRSPDVVLGYLERAIDELQAGNVAVERTVERNRVSKPLEGYSQNTQNVAALKRARE